MSKALQLLQEKAEAVRSGAELLLEKTRDWQTIREFMCNRHNDFFLTKDQEKKLERYQFIQGQFSKGKYSKAEIIAQLTNPKMWNIGLTQAYEDIRHTQELFSTVLNYNKKFELLNELEIAKGARAKCLEVFDFKNAAAFGKVIISLNAMMPEEEDTAGLDFKGHTIEATFDPALLGAPDIDMNEVLAALNAKRNVPIKIDMFTHLQATDIPHEDIKDEPTATL